MTMLKNVQMQDKQRLSFRVKTGNGYLRAPANFSRTGIYKYTGEELGIIEEPKRIFNVFRPSDEVFREDSLKSFSDMPVTLQHPPEMLNTLNTKLYSVGYSGTTVEKFENYVKGDLTIIDQHAIDTVEKGMTEISLGYLCDYEETSGETMGGEPYDFIQRNIRGNHIAIVPSGRAGEKCEIYDSANPIIEGELMPKKLAGTVEKKLIEGELTTDADVAELVSNSTENTTAITPEVQDNELSPKTIDGELKGMIDGLSERLTKMEQDLCSLKGSSNDECKEEVEDMDPDATEEVEDKKSSATDQAVLDAAYQIADELINVREKALKRFPSISFDRKTPEEIRKEVVIKTFTNENFDNRSVDYMEARFDALPENSAEKPSYMLSQMGSATRDSDHEISPAQKAFEESKEKYKS